VREMTPREIVTELDKYIVGQDDAKKAVAIALRNRWRWRQLPDEIRKEVTPKNIIMIGPTGVGKTEITRRLARLTGAPFVKIEATKYTEVGYYGRDVESMIRDLVEKSVNLVTVRKREAVVDQAKTRVENRLLELLLPDSEWEPDDETRAENEKRLEKNREKFRKMLLAGKLEEREVELTVEQRNSPVQVFSSMGMDQMDNDMQSMLEKIMPKQSSRKVLTVASARQILLDQETESLLDQDAINEEAINLAQDTGIVFVDEIDKICGSQESGKSSDVSRQGVQRDLLPIVEGTTVQTKYGHIKTDHILFIAAGAFHRTRPADLMPELQGRFPIRVELQDLTQDEFVRILTEPTSSLTRQYCALLESDGIKLDFKEDGIKAIAKIAFEVNQNTQNIGARRLYTIMERLLEDISFAAPNTRKKKLNIDEKYVYKQLKDVIADEDLSQFIL
jgi:ATP-dependent HslUV protease ATP-binding subunit HslU